MSAPDELPEDLFLDIAEHRALAIEYVAGRLQRQVDLGEYQAMAAAALVVAIFSNDLTDARSYRWLRDEIDKTMVDPNDWDHDEAEPSVLANYVRHLAAATHGTCQRCRESIAAGDVYEDVVPSRPALPMGRYHGRCL